MAKEREYTAEELETFSPSERAHLKLKGTLADSANPDTEATKAAREAAFGKPKAKE